MSRRWEGYTLSLLGLFLTAYILFIGKSLLMPFLIAIIVTYLLVTFMNYYKKRLKVPSVIALIMGIISFIVILFFIGFIINNSINNVVDAASEYQQRFVDIIKQFYDLIGADESRFTEDVLSRLDFAQILRDFAQMVTSIAGNSTLILIYTIFLLFEYKNYKPKLEAFCKEKTTFKEVDKIVDEISADVGVYVRVKTFISVLTGVLSYIVLRIIGVDFAEFWAFLIFLFNYIPVVGSLVAVSFPILLSLVQFPGFVVPAVVTVCLFGIQFIVSNFIEPPLLGNSLNLSPVVIILSLALWGSIWGIIGMILCIPITVIVSIVLSKFPNARPVAILLSAKGRIDQKG